jgi:multidrug efflux pump subunit AcrA (membrane-fusion protein)
VDALIVPSSAVHTDATTQKHYVETVDALGSFRQVVVTTGLVVGVQTEILSGVTEGTVVVTSGSTSSTGSTSTSGTGGAGRGGGGVFRMFGG